MRFLQTLIVLTCGALALAVDQPNYIAAKAAAAKKGVTIQVNHSYAFKVDGPRGHRRLIVGTVTGTPGSMEFQAHMFDMANITPGKLGPLQVGAKCITTTNGPGESWDCTRPTENFRFMGETKAELTKVEIADMGKYHSSAYSNHYAHVLTVPGKQLLVGNDCYNIVTNNCRTYVHNLFGKIKARDLLNQARQLFGRDVQFVERDPYEWNDVFERDFEVFGSRDNKLPALNERGIISDEMLRQDLY